MSNPDTSPAASGATLPLVTLVLPAYNESAILADNFRLLHEHLRGLASRYRFEYVIVNDGSSDETGAIADALAREHAEVRVIHHYRNAGLGQGFKTGFAESRGDIIVTLDIDMSYAPDHIDRMLATIESTGADLVLASPYMEGGEISNVPPLRRFLSIWANRFLSMFARGRLSTLTCMVRAYRGDFARGVVLRAVGMEVMPETIYKAMILRRRIVQIPAHLDWSRQIKVGQKRRSSMRILRHTFATLLSGFVFRPFMFFVLPGVVLLAFSLWVNFWMFMHFVEAFVALGPQVSGDRVSLAVASAYRDYPHTFIVGLLSLMLGIQLTGLGVLALQAKSYFEELFYLGSQRRR